MEEGKGYNSEEEDQKAGDWHGEQWKSIVEDLKQTNLWLQRLFLFALGFIVTKHLRSCKVISTFPARQFV